MGKVRNLRRNPPVSADDLLDSGWGHGTVMHLGQELEVVRHGSGSRPYILKSAQGVQYAATTRRDGSVSVELLGLA